MSKTVTIAGAEPDGLLSVEDRQEEGDTLGGATVRVTNSRQNRQLAAPGAEVVVTRNGTETFRGPIVGTPSGGDGVLSIKVEDRRVAEKYGQAQQVLYDISRSEAVEQLVTKRSQPLSAVPLTDASSLADWSGTNIELYGGTRERYRRGTDLVYLDAPRGTGGTLTATYDGVTSDQVGDGLYALNTRFLVPPFTDAVAVEVELHAPDGTPYVWTLESPTTGFRTYNLRAEDARPGGSQAAPGELQYRFALSGETATDRGVWVDYAESIPYRLRERAAPPDTTNVVPTNDSVIRRVDGQVSSILNTLATEAEYDWWIEGDGLYFQPGATEDGGLAIVEGETPVVAYDLDPDYDSITNAVTVQGAGDIEATASDGQSIDFYGVEPHTRTIVDRTIQRQEEAQARAEGILRDEGNDDLSMTWTVADTAYAALTPRNTIRVVWPSEDLDATYAVTSVASNDDGTVTVGLTGSSQSRR